jgi:hypothetical protein
MVRVRKAGCVAGRRVDATAVSRANLSPTLAVVSKRRTFARCAPKDGTRRMQRFAIGRSEINQFQTRGTR